jgi:DNA mismatch repair protein MutS
MLRWAFLCPDQRARASQRTGVSVTTTAVAELRAGAQAAFCSILFPGPEPPAASETPETFSIFSDLNLDQIIHAVTAGRDAYDLKPLFHAPLRDVDTIIYRHEIMRDLDRPRVAGALRRFAQRFRDLRQHLTLVENLRYKHNRNGWVLHAATIYCETVLSLKNDLQHADPNSRGLLALKDYLIDYTASD